MKTLLFAMVLLLGLSRIEAATFKLDGDLTWEITEPRLTFKLDGGIQNLSSGTSGTIKLVLVASPAPYPSAGAKIVGEFMLGQISGGYQFSDFTVKTTSNLGEISGNYHFTILVTEYVNGLWVNRLLVRTGSLLLINGNFATQQKWKISTKTVTSPPSDLRSGDVFSARVKATDPLNLFPAGSQLRTTLDVKNSTTVSAKNSFGKRIPAYAYKTVKVTFNNKTVKAGRLTLTYPKTDKAPKATEVITFFFQGANSGTYKSAWVDSKWSETTWGNFTFE